MQEVLCLPLNLAIFTRLVTCVLNGKYSHLRFRAGVSSHAYHPSTTQPHSSVGGCSTRSRNWDHGAKLLDIVSCRAAERRRVCWLLIWGNAFRRRDWVPQNQPQNQHGGVHESSVPGFPCLTIQASLLIRSLHRKHISCVYSPLDGQSQWLITSYQLSQVRLLGKFASECLCGQMISFSLECMCRSRADWLITRGQNRTTLFPRGCLIVYSHQQSGRIPLTPRSSPFHPDANRKISAACPGDTTRCLPKLGPVHSPRAEWPWTQPFWWGSQHAMSFMGAGGSHTI